ncbi:MAG: hypothetical protein AAFU61_06330, partial [Pseudomonadota bacterium]
MIRLLLYALLALGAALLVDRLTRRLADRGECGLHRALLLRDTCRGRCPPGQRCETAETRPYLWGGVQSAGCACRRSPRLRGLARLLERRPLVDGLELG